MTQQAPDARPLKARLYTVSEPLDRPVDELIEGEEAVDVQFNPVSLKVSLSNSLKENESSGNTRAAQYVDKSSSSLTVELIFDTTDYQDDGSGESEPNAIDVRTKTGKIARTFMTTTEAANNQQAPKRCLFQWGSFAFVGIMESFDETLDFFSPEGTPLRATVALKLSESRFEFRSKDAQEAEQDTPILSSPGEAAPVSQINSEAGKDEKDWRDTAMFNGIESPRLPSASLLAVPKLSAGVSLGVSGSIGAGISGSIGVSGGIGGGLSTSASAKLTPPSFKFGASTALGTGIAGAFSTNTKAVGGVPAGAIVAGGASLRGGASASLPKVKTSANVKASAGVGFD